MNTELYRINEYRIIQNYLGKNAPLIKARCSYTCYTPLQKPIYLGTRPDTAFTCHTFLCVAKPKTVCAGCLHKASP